MTITTGNVDEFFVRGKLLAQKVDAGETIEPSTFIMYEDPEDLCSEPDDAYGFLIV